MSNRGCIEVAGAVGDGVRISRFITLSSGRPYNIVTRTKERDLRGRRSRLFGTSTALSGGGQGGVRRLDLRLRFDF